MRKDLFKKYAPKWFHQLKVGDFVWAVSYGKWPGINKYVITGIKTGDGIIMYEIERDIKETEFGFIGMYNTWFYIDSNKPVCSAKSASYYHKRVFSDETVAKYSLEQHIKHLKNKLNGRINNLKRYIEHAEKLEEYMGNKLLKQEKTCRCTESLTMLSERNDSELTYHNNREYQVDVFSTAECSTYKVYQNGGWDDYVRLDEKEFAEHFELIK